MADDIVTRLREYAELEESDLLEAADEIERLRVAGERLWIHLDAHYGTGSPCPDDIQRVLDAWQEARRG